MALTPDLLTSNFRSWLTTKNYSASTVRNYLVDINKYLSFLPALHASKADYFDANQLSTYITAIKGQNNFSRQLASLNQLCQFALDQKMITSSPLKQILRSLKSQPYHKDINTLIQEFRLHLESKKKTPSTIKNYINDLRQFINWAQSQDVFPCEGESPKGKGFETL